MAFRMTRPTIQGTEYHKASVLKAKAETVAQTRTAADPTLVAAASALGKSNISKAIDFTIKPAEIKIPEGDGGEKKPREKEKQTDNAFNDVNKDGNVLSRSGKVIGKGVVNGVGVLIGASGQILNAAGDILEGTVNAAGEVVDLAGNVIGGVLGGVDKVLKGIDQTVQNARNKYEVKQAEKAELIKKGIQENSIELDPQTIRPLPTTKAKEELFKGTGSVDNYIYQQGRFEKAAQEFGFNISQEKINHVVKRETVDADGNTVIKEVGKRLETDQERDQRVRKNYEAAQEAMEYNDPGAEAIAAGVEEGWQKPGVREEEIKPGTIITPEQQAQADKDAKNQAEVDKMNAEKLAEIDAREALKLQKAKEKAEALQLKKDQEAKELKEKNKAIREQNKAIVEAKEFYGITGDGKLTRSKLEEYQNMRILQAENEAKYQQNPIEIEEERSREWNEAPPGQETVSNRSDLQKGGKIMDVDNDGTPDFIQKPTQVEPGVQPTATTTSQTTQNVTNTKPKLSDFKDGKNAFGGHMSKNQAYDEAMRKWRRENPNPIQMRDDAIYKNAIKDGIVQRNMIKSGYKPLD